MVVQKTEPEQAELIAQLRKELGDKHSGLDDEVNQATKIAHTAGLTCFLLELYYC